MQSVSAVLDSCQHNKMRIDLRMAVKLMIMITMMRLQKICLGVLHSQRPSSLVVIDSSVPHDNLCTLNDWQQRTAPKRVRSISSRAIHSHVTA